MTDDMRPQPGDPAAEPPGEPAFNIPAILVAWIGAMLAIHLFSEYAGSALVDRLAVHFAFRSDLYAGAEGDAVSYWLGPITYSLLHGSWAHVGFNSLWLAVFGTPVARRLSTGSFILFWVTSAIAAAFFFAASTGFEPAYLVGASGVVSATSGAVCRFAIGRRGFAPAALEADAPRLSILGALRRRSVLAFVIFSLASNILVGIGLSGDVGGSPVAWQAHIGGFLFGYLFFGLFDRRHR